VSVSAPTRQNASPAEGFQHFGEVDVDRRSRALTVRLRDLDGRSLWTKIAEHRGSGARCNCREESRSFGYS
jgi:alkaline phosphatase D